jgi:tetratricopeptide (TPR) repeat protein/O-antigen ligase
VNRAVRSIDGALEAGVVALLVFAPLPLGSVRPWAQVAIEGSVALLLTLWIVRMAVSGELEVRWTPLLWPAMAMAGLVGWQLLSPGGSADPYATWESARLYGAYLGLLLVVSGLPMTRARVTRLTIALVGWAVVLAGVGFAHQFGAGASWLPANPDATGRLTSTFVNPNHQALYFSLALFVTLGLLLRPSTRGSRGGHGRSGLERSQGPLGSLPIRVLLAGGVLVLALALVLTLSRGGIVSTVAGLLAMLALALSSRAGGRALLPFLVIAFGVTVYAGWVGLDAVGNRFAAVMREPVSDLRWSMWRATLRVVGDAPVTGVGLGAFQDGFSPYRPVEVPAERVVDYAHNDFLQLLAEAGITGLLIGVWALAALLVFTVRSWRGRRDPFVRGMVLGGVGAVVAAMVHSLIDFGLHMPANAVVLAVVAGLLPLVVTLHQNGTEERVGLAGWRWRLSPQLGAVGVVVAVLVATAAAVLLVPPGVAAWHRATAAGTVRDASETQGVPTHGDLAQARVHLLEAVAWDRWNPAGWVELAEISAQLAGQAWTHGVTSTGERVKDMSVDTRLRAAQPLLTEAYEAYRVAVRLRPRASEAHERLGWFLGSVEGIRLAVGRDAAARRIDAQWVNPLGTDGSVVPEALAHLKDAVRWEPQNAYRYRSLGLFALSVADQESGHEVASAALGQALLLRPDFLDGILDEMLARRVDDRFLLSAMPRKFEVVLAFGRELEHRGKPRAAQAAFEAAVELAPTPAREVEARLEYARAFIGRKDPLAALDQARRALVLAPKEAEVFAVLARIHAQTSQGPEAETALATAVALVESDPPSQRNRLRGELAALFVQRGQWEHAMTLWRQILREKPNDAWAHLELGRMLEQRGEASGALQEYRTAFAVGGEDWRLHQAVARALRDGGYLREAVTSYEVAQRLRPTDGDLGAELGDLYARIGLEDQAMEQYRQVLRREPDHAGARQGLARVKVSAGS